MMVVMEYGIQKIVSSNLVSSSNQLQLVISYKNLPTSLYDQSYDEYKKQINWPALRDNTPVSASHHIILLQRSFK
jgi:hypothetical protein